MMLSTRSFLVAALASAIAPLAFSHGTWVTDRTGAPTIVYGEIARDDAYNPEKVVFVQGFDKAGNPVDVKLIKQEKNVVLDTSNDFHSVAVLFDNGFWSKDANGEWVNKPKNEVEGAQSGSRSVKTNLSFLEEGAVPAMDALEKLPLVILPDGNVAASKAGEKINVTVYFEGKPLAGAKLIGDYLGATEEVVATTDDKGQASVPVRNTGLNVIETSHSTPPAEADKDKADKVSYSATLSFINAQDDD